VISHDVHAVAMLLGARSNSTDVHPQMSLTDLAGVLRDVDSGDRSRVTAVPETTVDEMKPGDAFRTVYVRGLIYLRAGQREKAIVQFQRILDHRTVMATSPVYPLALLQQARAFVQINDLARARSAYEKALAFWADADRDIPAIAAARAEYARLCLQ
jgi:tetratricopeptide (TPR) repeat protein